MKATYRFLGLAIATLVVLQAAAIAVAMFGVGSWVGDGHALTKSAMEGDSSVRVTDDWGFAVHAIVGMMLIPLLALVMLVVSFFAHVPGGIKWAGIVVGVVVLQVALAVVAHSAPVVGALHGINAFVLAGVASTAAARAGRGRTDAVPARERQSV